MQWSYKIFGKENTIERINGLMNKEKKSEGQFRRFCKDHYRFSAADIEKAVDFRRKETVRGLDKAIPSFVNAYILNNGNGKLRDSIRKNITHYGW